MAIVEHRVVDLPNDVESDAPASSYLQSARRQYEEAQFPSGLPGAVEAFPKFTKEAVEQGLLLGFGDEVSAAGGYVGGKIRGSEKSYEDYLRREQAAGEEFREDNPAASLTAQVLGGLGLAGPLAQASKAVRATIAGPLMERIPRFLRVTGAGGAIGGLYGAGSAKPGLKERAVGAGVGAAMGAATAGAVYPVIRGGEALVGQVGKLAKGRFAPEDAAMTAIRRGIQQDEMTPDRVSTRLRHLGPQATLADAGGENLLGVARAAGSAPGRAKNRAEQLMKQRAGGESTRISNKLGQTLSARDFFTSADEFVNTLKTQAAPMYEKAYRANQSIMSPELSRALNTPAGKRALRRAAIKMQNDRAFVGKQAPDMTAAFREAVEMGRAKGPLTGVGIAKGLKLRTLDYAKRALDDMIGVAYRTGQNDEARILRGLKNTIVEEADAADKTGLYAKARKTWAGDKEVVDALEEGRKFLGLDPEEITKHLGELSGASQKAYRAGAARALKDTIERAPDMAGAAKRIFGNQMVRKKIRAVMPDSRSYNELSRTLTSESRFSYVKNKVLGGSPTQPRLAEERALEQTLGRAGAIIGSELPVGGHPLVKAGVFRQMFTKMGLTEEALDERNQILSRMLFSRNQAENQQLVDKLIKTFVPEKASTATRAAIENAVLRALAQQGALKVAPGL